MRIVFAGTPEPALPSLQRLIESPRHDVIAVLTRPDAAAGRRGKPAPSPVARLADAAGIPVLRPARPNSPAFIAELTQLAPECCAVVAYGALLSEALLAVPEHGWINLHFSLLPAWRGAAPVQRAILHGDAMTGATTFLLERGLDTGPVLGVLTEEIRPRDTAGELLERLAQAGAGLLVATVDGLADGKLRAVPQPADGVSLAPKLAPADARINWATPAMHVDRLVRACTPAPGAWSTFRDRRVKLGPVVPTDADAMPAGSIVGSRDTVLVGTATSPVALGTVQPEGKPAMAAIDWARGARLTPEDGFA